MKYDNNLFDSIKGAIAKQQQQSSNNGTKNILTFEKGNTYVVRLLPNIKDPENTWFRYFTFGWKSFSTGAYISAISPTSWGERDPIAEERIKIYRTGSETDKERIKEVRRTERWLMNVYVVSDPTNPDNNGQVRLMRFGKQLYNIINNAIAGEDADEFGARVFDLSANGVNLKIKVDDQGGFMNYTASRFTSPVDLKLNEQQIQTIYDSVFEPSKVFTVRSYNELKELFDTHYYGTSTGGAESNSAANEIAEKAVEAAAAQFAQSPNNTGDGAPGLSEEELNKLIKEIEEETN